MDRLNVNGLTKTKDRMAEEGLWAEKDGSAWLFVPPQSERTERDETDIEIAWRLVRGKDRLLHLLDSTEGHLAVFRAIRYGRRTTDADAADRAGQPTDLERERQVKELVEAARNLIKQVERHPVPYDDVLPAIHAANTALAPFAEDR